MPKTVLILLMLFTMTSYSKTLTKNEKKQLKSIFKKYEIAYPTDSKIEYMQGVIYAFSNKINKDFPYKYKYYSCETTYYEPYKFIIICSPTEEARGVSQKEVYERFEIFMANFLDKLTKFKHSKDLNSTEIIFKMKYQEKTLKEFKYKFEDILKYYQS
ncbi:hypothetical protein LNTAR_15247 [Lentisphaera araneosa HTCC2155]|uniref:Uncharacterized protein n=1 Tax=Lentisphaera araneosa HTCC2155 TaxID=313628 RepID=A6DRH4_9BACT|nr:hypothetical protein [Lentisphaera araneosa]EDM25784.1 hypothetical protein LNTAR_15247 [Lentisphaera araneosa HTCC2155]